MSSISNKSSGPGNDGNEAVLRIPQKLQHYWNLTIRLFSVISRTLVRVVLPISREAAGVFYSPRERIGSIKRIINK